MFLANFVVKIRKTMVKAPKNIAVIGATGSIGTQTLEIINSRPDLYKATVIAAGRRAVTVLLSL